MTCIPAAATIVAVSTVLLVTGVCAQAPPAAPAAPAPAVAAPAPAPAPAQAAPRAKNRSPNRADARVCLDFPTNLQVIQCSEKFRYTKGPG